MMTLGLVIAAISNPSPTAAQLPLPLHTWREVGCNCAILRLHPSASHLFSLPLPHVLGSDSSPPPTLKLALGKDRNTFTLRTPDLNPLMSFCVLESSVSKTSEHWSFFLIVVMAQKISRLPGHLGTLLESPVSLPHVVSLSGPEMFRLEL